MAKRNTYRRAVTPEQAATADVLAVLARLPSWKMARRVLFAAMTHYWNSMAIKMLDIDECRAELRDGIKLY